MKTDVWGLQRRKVKVNVQFEKKMHRDIDRNRKLFWKEVSQMDVGNLEMGGLY